MDKNKKLQTVVQGEASESDEEQVESTDQAIVVEGEASESDEEEVDTSINSSPDIQALKVDYKKQGDGLLSELNDIPTLMSASMAESRISKPKYETLLHKKLRDSNWILHDHMVNVSGQMYLGAARNLHNTTQQLIKSYAVAQDISHTMRLLTNDLFHLDDRIDIILSCKLLPDIMTTATSAEGPQSPL